MLHNTVSYDTLLHAMSKTKKLFFRSLNVIFFLFALYGAEAYSFQTLSDARIYAQKHAEYPEIDNEDIEKPDFSSLYRQLRPSLWSELAHNLGFKRSLWQPADAERLLKKIMTQTKKESDEQSAISKSGQSPSIRLVDGSQVVIIGDLDGAFHSLVRDLTELERRNIINNDFKIVSENTFIIFTGNAIGFTPYSLETLTILMRLLEQNPQKFFYIAGEREAKKTWYQTTLREEILKRGSFKKTELSELIDTFFSRLPQHIIGTMPHTQEKVLFTYEPKGKLYDVVVQGEDPLDTYANGQGLYKINKPNESTTWTVISAPTQLNRVNHSFFYDAFALIQIGKSLSNSTITNYYLEDSVVQQDASQEGFKKGARYNFLTGAILNRGELPQSITAPDPIPPTPELLQHRIDYLQEHLAQLEKRAEFIRRQIDEQGVFAVNEQSKKVIKTNNAHKDPKKKQIKSAMFSEVTDSVESKVGSHRTMSDDTISAAMSSVDKKPVADELTAVSEMNKKQFKESSDSELIVLLERLYNTLVTEVEQLEVLAVERGLRPFTLSETEKKSDSLVLGSTLDLSKSVKGLGIPFRTGMALKVNKQNKEGGIQGKWVQIIFFDDGYIPSQSRKNIETLLYQYHTPFILCPVGSPTLMAAMDLIEKKKIAVLFPQSGSPAFRKPDLTHIVNFRASFADEGYQLTQYVLKTHLPKNFVFFYQNDSFGISILNGAREALKDAKITGTVEVSYLANTTFFKDAAQKIRDANPDAIGFFATGPATIQLIRDIGIEFLANKTLYAVSSVGDEATVKVLKDKGLTVILGQLVPNPHTSKLPIVKEYRDEVHAQGLQKNVFSLESYIATSITFDIMNKIKGPITMNSVLKAMEDIKDWEYKGLKLTFNPATRSLAQSMWIDTGTGEWLERSIKREADKRDISVREKRSNNASK